MKLRNIFVAVTVTLVAIAIAAPADAQIKCKAKQDKKTGAIGYSFVNKAAGTVVYSYSDLDPSPGTPHNINWGSFANENTCQSGGKGRNCVVSNDAAEAAIAPSSCKIYMADLTSGDKCELYIKGCQVAQRPPPTTGWFGFDLGPVGSSNSPAAWDAETGIAWYISPDNQARSLDNHKTYLSDVLNGGTSDGTDFACLTDGCDLELPTLAQLQKLGEDCAAVAVQDAGSGGWTYFGQGDGTIIRTQGIVCAALWPDPSLGEPANCAWSSTVDASDPAQAYAVCVVEPANAKSSSLIAVSLVKTLSTADPLQTLSQNNGNCDGNGCYCGVQYFPCFCPDWPGCSAL
jgi:hypothetical protein